MTNHLIFTGTLVARTAVHAGSGQANELTDALLRRTVDGRIELPGPTLAGVLRAVLTNLAPRLGWPSCHALTGTAGSCTCPVCHLLGDIQPEAAPGAPAPGAEPPPEWGSSASRLVVDHAPLTAAPPPTIRDGVGIDRVTGAAARAAAAKFDLEVLGAGATFALRMELQDTPGKAAAAGEALLAAGLAEWQAGRAWLGGRAARGLGAFALHDLQVHRVSLVTADDLANYLAADDPLTAAQPVGGWLPANLQQIRPLPAPGGAPDPAAWVEIRGTLQADGPLLTNDAGAAAIYGFDHAPLLVQAGDLGHPVLAGAGLRGVLRSHAERIARTLAAHGTRDAGSFLGACPACDPLQDDPSAPLASCTALLGAAARAPGAGQEASPPPAPGDLCLACRLFGSTQAGSRLFVEDAPYVDTGGAPRYKMLDFLAVDRFTGGGAEHLKFDALALWQPAFSLRLHLGAPAPWELGWLLLVLRDLADGWLHVGYGAAKGFGRVHLADATLRAGYLDPDAAWGLPVPPWAPGEGIYAVAEWPLGGGSWPPAANEWVGAFTAAVHGYRRPRALQLARDGYFNGLVDRLYPLEVTL